MSVAFLFPGQGSQRPGMLHDLPDHSAVKRTLAEASETLGFDALDLDSAEALATSAPVQLALLLSGVAAARVLQEEGVQAEAVAGLSVGAFAAAVHCGTLEFADAVRLVRQRAEGMAALYPSGYGLAAIVGLSEEQVRRLVGEVHGDASPVYVGNINAPRQIVIAGSVAAMDKVLDAALQHGATKAERLRVSVPSHCPLLEPVAEALGTTLRTIPLHRPKMVFVGNVDARPLRTAEAIANDLAGNIAHGVRWHDATVVLSELGCDLLVEMPPGHVLTELAKSNIPEVRAIALGESTVSHVLKLVAG